MSQHAEGWCAAVAKAIQPSQLTAFYQCCLKDFSRRDLLRCTDLASLLQLGELGDEALRVLEGHIPPVVPEEDDVAFEVQDEQRRGSHPPGAARGSSAVVLTRALLLLVLGWRDRAAGCVPPEATCSPSGLTQGSQHGVEAAGGCTQAQELQDDLQRLCTQMDASKVC